MPGILDALTIQISADTSQIARSMASAEAAMKAAAGRMTSAFDQLDRIGSRLGATLGAVFSGVAVAGLARYTTHLIDAAGALGEVAEQAGVTAGELQALTAAGVQSGVTTEELVGTLSRFSRTLGEAQVGSESASKTFRRLGVSIKDSGGEFRQTFDVFLDVAQRISEIESPAQKFQVGSELMGKSFAKLLPLLSQGRAGIEKFAAELKRLGLALDEREIAKMDAASDRLATFADNLDRFAKKLASDAVPMLERFLGLAERVTGLESPERRVERDIEMMQRRWGFRLNAGPVRRFVANRIEDLREQRRRLGQGAAGSGASGLRGFNKDDPRGNLAAEPSALDKYIGGLDDAVSLAKLSGLERAQEAAIQRAKDIAEKGGGTLGADKAKTIRELIAMEHQAADATKRREEAEKRLGDALDAEDASMGQLLKTQREVEARKHGLIAAGDEEIRTNSRLIAALEQSEEAYRVELRMQQLLAQAKRDGIEVTDELLARFRQQAAEAGRQDQTLERLKDGYEEARRAAADFANVIGTAFEDAILRGAKLSDVVRSLGEDLARIALRVAVTKPFENLLTGASSGAGGGASSGGVLGFLGNAASSVAGSALNLFGGVGGGGMMAALGLGAEVGSPALLGAAGFTGGALASLAPLLSIAGPAALALGGGFALSKLFGGGKPSVGPGGGSGVMFNGAGVDARFLAGDNGYYSGGQTIGLAQQAAHALNELAARLGTSVTAQAQGAFGEGQGRLWFGFEGDLARPETSPERAVADYVRMAVERGALAGVSSLDDSLVAAALAGKLEQAMAQLEGQSLGRLASEFARLGEQIDRTADGIRSTIDNLSLDENLSPLDPMARLAEARRQFSANLALAQGGDLDAAAQSGQLGRALLGINQDVYARSSGEYRGEFAQVSAGLASVEASLGSRAAEIASLTARSADAIAGEQLSAIRELTEAFNRLARDLRNAS